MTKNDLQPGQSRIGFAWDERISEPYPAMLVDVDGRIELVVPFDETSDELRRRYIGDFVRWGDDPEMSRFDYTVPEQFWFADAHGFVCLVGVRRRQVDPLAGGPTTMSECRLGVTYALFTGGPDANYSRVNGITSEIEGLGRWFGRRSVSVPMPLPSHESGVGIPVTIHSPTITRLAATMNLSLLTGADWSMPGEPGLTSIEEVGRVRTTLGRPRDWAAHLDLHKAIHELLELSAWNQLGFQSLKAMHHRDPQRVLSGDIVGERWAPVRTYALPKESSNPRPIFFFEFDDIGAIGVRRWLLLRNSFSRGVAAMTFSIRHDGTSLDGLISDSGIGLEEIGHRIAADHGRSKRRGHHLHLEDIASEIVDLLPFDGKEWATRSTEVYNNVKHADRPDSSTSEMVTSLRENRLVFRIWVARRLGVKDQVIRRNAWLLNR